MVATDHKWNIVSKTRPVYIEEVVPTIQFLKGRVKSMIYNLIVQNLAETSSGGFTVKWYEPRGTVGKYKDTIQVSFKPVVDVFIPVKVK